MKEYQRAELVITEFEEEDVITTSGVHSHEEYELPHLLT